MNKQNAVPRYLKKPIPVLAFLGALLLLGPVTTATAADEDGCYFPPNRCLSVSSQWTSSGNLKINLQNNCQAGIYAKWCAREADGGESCGASHIGKGRTYTSTMYNPADSGRHAWRFVGSKMASKDWVCAGKISNWREDFSY